MNDLGGDWFDLLGHQLGNTLRELRTLASPVVDALALQVYRSRVGARVVGADHLDGAAVAGTVLFNYNDAIIRLLARANARQTNHQHSENPFKTAL